MPNVLEFRINNPDIGFIARKQKKGPEYDLVQGFISAARESFYKKSSDIAIFYEPQLDTGFPDIVFVEYGLSAFDNWTDARNFLSSKDLKLLHHLSCIQGADSDELNKQLGLCRKSLSLIIERLLEAKLIRRYARQWQPIRLKHTFGVTRISSFEAKINDWRSVFQQAGQNKWFASESNVLSPVFKPSSKVLESSAKMGVGIYTFNRVGLTQVTSAQVGSLPSCYASWLFNEWIGRTLWGKKGVEA